MRILKWPIVLLLASLATLATLILLGLAATLLGSGLSIATFGDSVVGRYQAIFYLTVAAGIMASILKLVVLVRHRAEHKLRVTEYIEPIASAGFLAAGLSFGALALVIATMRELTDESLAKEVVQSAAPYAFVPILVTFMAVFITVSEYIERIPQSRELSSSERIAVQACQAVRNHVRFVVQVARERARRNPAKNE